MKYRPNPTLHQWNYQMQQQASQEGYVKKKGCNCGGKKKTKDSKNDSK